MNITQSLSDKLCSDLCSSHTVDVGESCYQMSLFHQQFKIIFVQGTSFIGIFFKCSFLFAGSLGPFCCFIVVLFLLSKKALNKLTINKTNKQSFKPSSVPF